MPCRRLVQTCSWKASRLYVCRNACASQLHVCPSKTLSPKFVPAPSHLRFGGGCDWARTETRPQRKGSFSSACCWRRGSTSFRLGSGGLDRPVFLVFIGNTQRTQDLVSDQRLFELKSRRPSLCPWNEATSVKGRAYIPSQVLCLCYFCSASIRGVLLPGIP